MLSLLAHRFHNSFNKLVSSCESFAKRPAVLCCCTICMSGGVRGAAAAAADPYSAASRLRVTSSSSLERQQNHCQKLCWGKTLERNDTWISVSLLRCVTRRTYFKMGMSMYDVPKSASLSSNAPIERGAIITQKVTPGSFARLPRETTSTEGPLKSQLVSATAAATTVWRSVKSNPRRSRLSEQRSKIASDGRLGVLSVRSLF